MYKQNKYKKTSIVSAVEVVQGERIEDKVERIMHNNEPIKDGAPLIFTERNDGVRPEHDIRTDRFEIAADAMDKVTASKIASREERIKEKSEKLKAVKGGKTEEKPSGDKPSGEAGGQSTNATT